MIRLTDTRHIFIIGALSGKGIAASMNMVILKSIIRTFLAETTDFKLLVEKVNSFIRKVFRRERSFREHSVFWTLTQTLFTTSTAEALPCSFTRVLTIT